MAYCSGLGATPTDKITTFATLVRAEADKCFAATLLKRDSDRALADEATTVAAQAVSAAKATADVSKAKKAIDDALARVLVILPQVKSNVANLTAIRQAATDAKKGIDERAAAARRVAAPVLAPGASVFDPSLETSSSLPKVAIVGATVVAALLLWPRKR